MSDVFPANLEVLFHVPQAITDEDLRAAIGQLAETLKADLIAVGAPVEVVMEASTSLNQFAKHMQASRQPYGYPENGGYSDPGSERAALSSLHNGLTSLREAMAKLRVYRMNPEQLAAALDERDRKFARCAQALFQTCREQEQPLTGDDLMFFIQATLFPLMQAEGLVE